MDLDLGNYERYLLTTLTRDHNITTGKIYQKVIEAERRGDYLGKTVQVYVTTVPKAAEHSSASTDNPVSPQQCPPHYQRHSGLDYTCVQDPCRRLGPRARCVRYRARYVI